MSSRMRRILQLTAMALLLIVAANAILLLGSWRNRSGEPDAELLFSKRELYVPYSWDDENSGRFIQLRYQLASEMGGDTLFTNPWLDRKKLKSLGYRLPQEGADTAESASYLSFPAKKVFVVLELQGLAYEQALAQAVAEMEGLQPTAGPETIQAAEEKVRQLRDQDSRLYVVDVGLDAQELRQHHSSKERYAIVPGQLRVWWDRGHKQNKPQWFSSITLDRERIFVPLEFAGPLARCAQQMQKVPSGGKTGASGCRVRLAFGTRLEPWVKELHAWTN